jgi:hypothetical protein
LVSCVVDEDVNAAEVIDSPLDHVAAMLRLLQVTRYKNRLTTFLFDELLDFVGVLGLAKK